MIDYKIDILKALKLKGFNTGVLRKNRLLSERVIQKIRRHEQLNFTDLNRLCALLDCQPSDLLKYTPDPPSSKDNNCIQ